MTMWCTDRESIYSLMRSTKRVRFNITSVKLESVNMPNSLILTEKDTYTISTSLTPSTATTNLTWSSSNPDVVAVDNGVLTAKNAGNAVLTCTAHNGVYSQCNVTVNELQNYLYSADFTGGAGGHVTLPILMKNDVDIAGFQFDVELPDGVSVSAISNGTPDVSTTNRAANHNISTSNISNGSRFAVFSLTNNLITGTSGAVMNIRLDIDRDLPLGEYNVTLKNVQLTQKNGAELTTLYAPDITFKLTVGSIETGDVNADGVVNVTDAIGIISYILEDTPTWFTESVADVNGDGQVNVTDVIGVIDMILSEASTKARNAE